MISIELIWEEFNTPLKAFIKKRINNEYDVEDLLQSIFLKIHNNIESLNEVGKLNAWIFTIARNTIYDYYRKQNKCMYIENLPENLFIDQQEEETLNKEISKCLKKLVQCLPEIYKEAIILTEYENYTQKELANYLGLSVSGAKSRVQRARNKLKSMILNCCTIKLDHRGNIIDYQRKNSECKYC